MSESPKPREVPPESGSVYLEPQNRQILHARSARCRARLLAELVTTAVRSPTREGRLTAYPTYRASLALLLRLGLRRSCCVGLLLELFECCDAGFEEHQLIRVDDFAAAAEHPLAHESELLAQAFDLRVKLSDLRVRFVEVVQRRHILCLTQTATRSSRSEHLHDFVPLLTTTRAAKIDAVE